MSTLKDSLIRLGSTNPDLQKHIRPVLDRVASEGQIKVTGYDDGYNFLDETVDSQRELVNLLADQIARHGKGDWQWSDLFVGSAPGNHDLSVKVHFDIVRDGPWPDHPEEGEDFIVYKYYLNFDGQVMNHRELRKAIKSRVKGSIQF